MKPRLTWQGLQGRGVPKEQWPDWALKSYRRFCARFNSKRPNVHPVEEARGIKPDTWQSLQADGVPEAKWPPYLLNQYRTAKKLASMRTNRLTRT